MRDVSNISKIWVIKLLMLSGCTEENCHNLVEDCLYTGVSAPFVTFEKWEGELVKHVKLCYRVEPTLKPIYL
jgi:hypothetical protein